MDDKLKQIQKLLDAAEGNLTSARNMLREALGDQPEMLDIAAKASEMNTGSDGTVIEGVFNGEEMIAPDGKNYPVPANYASKSKLVEGDGMKLTIADDGSFIYKQVSPVERRNIVGTLAQSDDGYTISAEGKNYKVLTASITFYRAEPGDTVTAIIPSDHDANWAAMENIVSKAAQQSDVPTTKPLDEAVMPDGGADTSDKATSISETVDEGLPVSDDVNEAPNEPTAGETTIDLPQDSSMAGDAQPASPETSESSKVDDNAPKIEMPPVSGTPLSDDQLLENLKANLRNIDTVTPAPQAPNVSSTPTVPTNMTATPAPEVKSQEDQDKPISELDI